MVRPRKAEDNEVTDREQYGTLVQSRLKRGAATCIYVAQSRGGGNPAKYKVELCFCTLLSNSLNAILRFGKDSVDQVQRHILAGSRLQG